MTGVTFVFHRYDDPSGVSGVGVVAEGCEFSDGAVAVRWSGKHPSTATWNDIRDAEAIHGHGGKTVVQYVDAPRLVRAYEQVMPYVLTAQPHVMPLKVDAHPEHPDCLRVILQTEQAWRWWVALLDGSTDTAVQEDIGGETEHRWTSPFGDIWCVYHTRHTTSPGLTWESHDDPEINR